MKARDDAARVIWPRHSLTRGSQAKVQLRDVIAAILSVDHNRGCPQRPFRHFLIPLGLESPHCCPDLIEMLQSLHRSPLARAAFARHKRAEVALHQFVVEYARPPPLSNRSVSLGLHLSPLDQGGQRPPDSHLQPLPL